MPVAPRILCRGEVHDVARTEFVLRDCVGVAVQRVRGLAGEAPHAADIGGAVHPLLGVATPDVGDAEERLCHPESIVGRQRRWPRHPLGRRWLSDRQDWWCAGTRDPRWDSAGREPGGEGLGVLLGEWVRCWQVRWGGPCVLVGSLLDRLGRWRGGLIWREDDGRRGRGEAVRPEVGRGGEEPHDQGAHNGPQAHVSHLRGSPPFDQAKRTLDDSPASSAKTPPARLQSD